MAVGTGTAILGSAVLGAGVSANASRGAAKAQRGAADDSAQVQREALESFNERTQPFVDSGSQALSPLVEAIINGNTPRSPLLDVIKDDVTRRLTASQAAQGRLGSGGTAEILAQALAPIELQQQQQSINNLFGLASMGSNAATGQGNAALQTGMNLGNTVMSGGLADAQGILGQGTAISGGINDAVGLHLLNKGGFFNRFGG